MADYAGDTLLPVREAGPQGPAARGDIGEAGGGLARDGWIEPGTVVGFTRAADSGVFQYSSGSLVRRAGAGGIFPEEEAGADDGGLARRGRGGAGALLCKENRCPAGDRG